MSSPNPPEYTIIPYFLHMRLLLALMPANLASALGRTISRLDNLDPLLRKDLIDRDLTGGVLGLIKTNKVPSLEEILLEGEPHLGQLVILNRALYYKGVSRAFLREQAGNKTYAEFHGKLKEFNNIAISGKFSPEHLTYSSSVGRLSGNCTRFIFAAVDEIKNEAILLRPILIGDRIYRSDQSSIFGEKNACRVFPEDIEEFSKLVPLGSRRWDVKRLKDIPERTVKQWFAELLNENNVPKDWGGERSDLFTTHMRVRGARVAAAFLLKGPAKFHPLSLKYLGVNGDQIVRLFDEPADVHVVQHCHYIKSEILHHLDAFSSRPHATSWYCALDGVDTLRILVGYGYL